MGIDPDVTRFRSLTGIELAIPECDQCAELRRYCAEVARQKRRAYADWTYWGRPVPGFGDHDGPILIVGLAPAAHGANRTGRMFTGDRSGDFLYAALHRQGMASQAESTHREDGLELSDVYITAALRCAPPGNRPTAEQLDNCRPYLVQEITLLRPRVIICLGQIGWNATLAAMGDTGHAIPRPRPKFAHGAEAAIGPIRLLGCYHVSQQNTFTGRLTEPMLDDVLSRAAGIAGAQSRAGRGGTVG